MKTQMSSIIWCFVLFTGLVTTACGDSPTESPSVQFRVLAVGALLDPIPPFALYTGPGEVEITGSLSVQCDQDGARGELTQLGDTLTATVVIFGQAPCVFDTPGELAYRFSIGNLEQIRYRVVVVHSYLTTSTPDTVVLDTSVDVL